jgi:hypothetical protein
MILGNYAVLNKGSGRDFGGGLTGGGVSKGSYFKPATLLNKFIAPEYDNGYAKYTSVPVGYRPPACYVLPLATGGLSMTSTYGRGAITAPITGVLDASLTVSGEGTMTATGGLFAGLTMLAEGTGGMSSNIGALISASLTMLGEGDISGSLSAYAGATMAILGTGGMTSNIKADASLTLDVTPFTPLSPQSLAAAVWESVASEFNDSGTMGQKLNGAGSAGDPWTTDLDSYTTPGTAGALMKKASKPKISL